MLRHTPTATLFPYTTLFRSLTGQVRGIAKVVTAVAHGDLNQKFTIEAKGRSEEHTSELQSPYDLVCRLLLEKKKGHNDQSIAVYSLKICLLYGSLEFFVVSE